MNSGVDHQHSAAIGEAARWVAATPPQLRPRLLVSYIRESFGLSVSEACQALKEASELRRAK
jgi:hypothetical protein